MSVGSNALLLVVTLVVTRVTTKTHIGGTCGLLLHARTPLLTALGSGPQ